MITVGGVAVEDLFDAAERIYWGSRAIEYAMAHPWSGYCGEIDALADAVDFYRYVLDTSLPNPYGA
jgi:hypothetical protein